MFHPGLPSPVKGGNGFCNFFRWVVGCSAGASTLALAAHKLLGENLWGKYQQISPTAWRHRLLKWAKKTIVQKWNAEFDEMNDDIFLEHNQLNTDFWIYTLKNIQTNEEKATLWWEVSKPKPVSFASYSLIFRDGLIHPSNAVSPESCCFNPDPCHLGHPGSMILQVFNSACLSCHSKGSEDIRNTSNLPSTSLEPSLEPSRIQKKLESIRNTKFLVFTSASDPLILWSLRWKHVTPQRPRPIWSCPLYSLCSCRFDGTHCFASWPPKLWVLLVVNLLGWDKKNAVQAWHWGMPRWSYKLSFKILHWMVMNLRAVNSKQPKATLLAFSKGFSEGSGNISSRLWGLRKVFSSDCRLPVLQAWWQVGNDPRREVLMDPVWTMKGRAHGCVTSGKAWRCSQT